MIIGRMLHYLEESGVYMDPGLTRLKLTGCVTLKDGDICIDWNNDLVDWGKQMEKEREKEREKESENKDSKERLEDMKSLQGMITECVTSLTGYTRDQKKIEMYKSHPFFVVLEGMMGILSFSHFKIEGEALLPGENIIEKINKKFLEKTSHPSSLM
jgi:hypothetical protein